VIFFISSLINRTIRLKMNTKMKYYRTRVYHFIVLFTKNEELAEDLTQDVMLKVWTRKDKLNVLEDVDNYILKMAKHHVIDHFKKLAREKKYQEEIWNRMQNSPATSHNPLIAQ